MLRSSILVCVVLVACKGDEKKSASSGGSSTGGMNMGSNPAGVIPKETGVKLTCDNVVPQAVRGKFFKDYTLEDQPQAQSWQGQCGIKGKDPKDFGSIMASCHAEMAKPEARQRGIEAFKQTMKDVKDLPGIGVAAMQTGDGLVSAYNENCQLNVTVPKGIDAVAVTKELLPLLPPK